MTRRAESTPRAALPGIVLLVTILAALGAALPTPAAAAGQEAETTASPDATSPGATSPDAAPPAVAEGGEEEWLIDEETGQRYQVHPIENLTANYRWVDEDTIRYRYGVHFDVVDYDDEYLWVKVYHTARKAPVKPRQKTEEEKAAELAELAASYESDIATVDRLTLAGFDNGLPRTGQWRQGFDVADMNGDGHLDLVFGPARKSTRSRPNIFLGDGAGNWRRWREARFAPLGYDYGDAAAGDFNGDGNMDLAFGVHLRGLLAVVGDGKGNFRAWTDGLEFDLPGQGGAATSFSSRALEVFDWNGDGRPDIFALGEGPKGRKTGPRGEVMGEVINTARGLVVYLNQGDGTWKHEIPTDNSFLRVQFGDDFTFGDWNRDGRDDIALASRMRNNKHMLGLSTEDGVWTAHPLPALRHQTFVGAVAAVDPDGDGHADLAIGYQTRGQDKIWRTGVDLFSAELAADQSLSWERRAIFASQGRRGIYSLETGDLDGDGHSDLVAVTGNGEIWIFLGDGEGFFTREESPEVPAPAQGCHGYALRLHDLDGDGHDELIAGFAGEQTGLPGIAELHQPGCPGEGSLRAWKAVVNRQP